MSTILMIGCLLCGTTAAIDLMMNGARELWMQAEHFRFLAQQAALRVKGDVQQRGSGE